MNPDLTLLRALRGAPLSVLLAIRYMGRAGSSDLESATGYEKGAVGRALHTLEVLGIICNVNRYHGWQLTTLAAQLPLFIPSELEGAKNALPLSGGGSLINLNTSMDYGITTTTTTAREAAKNALEGAKNALPFADQQPGDDLVDNPVDNFLLDPETARLAEILVDRVQCPRRRAMAAVAQARTDCVPAEIEIEILRWIGWFHSDKSNTSGIRNPGYFIAKKVSSHEPAPRGNYVVSWSDDDHRIQKLLCQLEELEERAS